MFNNTNWVIYAGECVKIELIILFFITVWFKIKILCVTYEHNCNLHVTIFKVTISVYKN